MEDELLGPLKPDLVKSLIREILRTKSFAYTNHALEELGADQMTTLNCESVLRSGVVQPPDFQVGTWRYRVETGRMAVVIAFRSHSYFVIVTGWRKG